MDVLVNAGVEVGTVGAVVGTSVMLGAFRLDQLAIALQEDSAGCNATATSPPAV